MAALQSWPLSAVLLVGGLLYLVLLLLEEWVMLKRGPEEDGSIHWTLRHKHRKHG